MHAEYDKNGDAIYTYLNDRFVYHTEKLDDLRYIDYAQDGTPVGIELLCVSEGVITNDLPQRSNIDTKKLAITKSALRMSIIIRDFTHRLATVRQMNSRRYYLTRRTTRDLARLS